MRHAVFKNFFEPGALVFLFTVGTIVNRRSQRRGIFTLWPHADREHGKPRVCEEHGAKYMPDNSRFRGHLVSRFLNLFPFLVEIWYWLLTYWTYQLARAYSAYLIRGNDAILQVSRAHALAILYFEHALRFDIELRLQHYIMACDPSIMRLLRQVYHSHIILGVAFLVYIYTFLPQPLYQKIRRMMALDNALAFSVLTVYRCMPPRLLPEAFGYVDIMHKGPQTAWTQNRFQLTIAAMPSLHFGNAVLIGFVLWKWSPHRVLRFAVLFWPVAMGITVIATANHWVLDMVVGAMIPLICYRYNDLLLYLRVVEEWGFWLCRTEKPREGGIEWKLVARGSGGRKDLAWRESHPDESDLDLGEFP